MEGLFNRAVVNIPHHVTQRGNARQFSLANEEERGVYLNLLRKYVNCTYDPIYTNNSLATTVLLSVKSSLGEKFSPLSLPARECTPHRGGANPPAE